MSRGVVSSARRREAQKHADRYWDCPCGRRVWGNGGKASHKRACVMAIEKEIKIHAVLAVSDHSSPESRDGELHTCGNCGGSGRAKDQVFW